MRFFISYSRSLKNKVMAVVDLLRAAGHEVWWDADIPSIADWWSTILDQIEHCEVMIFMISEKSVSSPYCMEEFRYASSRNRPVLPFIIDDHSQYVIPSEFGRRQRLENDDDPARMLKQISADCNQIDWNLYKDRCSQRPPEPGKGVGSVTRQFQQAIDLAEAGQFAEATRRFQSIATLDPKEWGETCHRWVNRLARYEVIAELVDHPKTLGRARAKWAELLGLDPEITADAFDPLLIQLKLNQASGGASAPSVAKPTAPILTAKQRLDQSADAIRALIGDPFAWCEVPAGDFLYGEDKQKRTLPAFAIAKYPITYRQFQTFINHPNGFRDARWWEGLEASADDRQTPGVQRWKIDTHPRERVSWYDAIAFCRWLSWRLGGGFALDQIGTWAVRLPTEFEWQKAARGTNGLAYPYGDTFDKNKSNTEESGIGKTTAVTQYLNGASPYGVVDMSGNVWEWCLTDYGNPVPDFDKENINSNNRRVLHGGSWKHVQNLARAAYRSSNLPFNRNDRLGFRAVGVLSVSIP